MFVFCIFLLVDLCHFWPPTWHNSISVISLYILYYNSRVFLNADMSYSLFELLRLGIPLGEGLSSFL